MTPVPACLPADLWTAVLPLVTCLATSLLSSSALKQPLIILSANPLEQSAFDFHYIADGCFCSRWQKKQRVAHPILVISEVAASWLRVLLCGFQNKHCLHPLPHYCLTGNCFRTHFYYGCKCNGCKTL